MKLATNQIHIKHLYSRAGFGIRYPELDKRAGWNIKKAVDELFSDSKDVEELSLDMEYTPKKEIKSMMELSPDERKELVRKARQNVRLLNTTWIDKMGTTENQLREKLTLFWHGHFACRSQNPLYIQQLNNIHRKYALGNFKAMVLEVSRSPAMLQFLNNQQNRKGRPNENFARELMELFTLGRGNYTEQDIKEAARAFTGWGFNREGGFQFREMLHDEGPKTFFGKSGNFNGTDIIDIILKKPEAANFIARKLYVFLVNDTVNESRVKELGAYFYAQDYDIADLVKKMLTSAWFYEPENIGNKIKSPVELLVGLNRQFGVKYQNPAVLLQFQSALGQVLFYPPNVAGWAGGKNWIDSSSLMVRLKIPSLVLNAGEIEFDGKADPEDEAIIAINQKQRKAVERRVQATANWQSFVAGYPSETKPEDLAGFLLQPKAGPAILNTLKNNINLKSAALELVSMPEYQLV